MGFPKIFMIIYIYIEWIINSIKYPLLEGGFFLFENVQVLNL
jgi:hypothetical protein